VALGFDTNKVADVVVERFFVLVVDLAPRGNWSVDRLPDLSVKALDSALDVPARRLEVVAIGLSR